MKPPSMRWLALVLTALMGCSSSNHFVRVTDENGNAKIVHPGDSPCYVIVFDSLNGDSSQHRLFSAKTDRDGCSGDSSSWSVNAIDTLQQTIEFKNCHCDTMSISLKMEQIKYLIVRPPGSSVRTVATDILALPAFTVGVLSVVWGVISLPDQSTAWQDDVKIIGVGLATIGLAVIVIGPGGAEPGGGTYRIESLH